MGFEFGGGGKRGKKAGFMRTSAPDPLADVEYTGDLEKDSASELDALSAAMRERRTIERERYRQATDSEYWVALCFRSRKHKEAFIAGAGAARLGDKYVDGHAFARSLGIDLPD